MFTKLKINLLIFSILITAPALFGQKKETVEIDISRSSEASKYFVVLAARNDSGFGHAFVIWGIEDATKRQSSYQAFGLYPKADSTLKNVFKAVFGRVEGQILDDVMSGSTKNIFNRLIVKVDSDQYKSSLAVLDKYSKKTDYSLIDKDCVQFVKEVGKSLGLALPERDYFTPGVWKPSDYIEQIIKEAKKP